MAEQTGNAASKEGALGVCDSPNRSKLRPLGPPAAQERLAQQGVWTLPTRTRLGMGAVAGETG